MSSDVLPEDAWIQSFLPTPPRPLLTALQRRCQASSSHVHALAELYKQRSLIEQQYAEALGKLARQAETGQLLGKGGVEWEKGGAEAKLWDGVVQELNETSASHSTFSALIRTDFEQPIRELPSKIVPWRRIGDQDASLEKCLKEYEKTSAKLEKATGKSSKSGKAEALSGELSQLTQSLSSLSPMVYTTYQRLDEERLKSLREIVARWGTVRGDMAGRDGQRAETAMARLFEWEVSDEVLSVGRRLGASGGGKPGAYNPSLASTNTTPVSNRRLSTAPSTTPTPANDFSPRPTFRQNGSSSNMSSGGGGSGFAGGIKSMLGRTKSTVNPASRGRSNSNATSVRSQGFAAIGEEDNAAPRSGGGPAPLVDEEGFSVAPADRHRSPWDEPNDEIPSAPVMALSSSTAQQQQPPNSATGASFSQTFASSPTASVENISSGDASSQHGAPPRLNLAMATAPIEETEEQRQAALARMQQTLAMPLQQQPSRRSTIARGRRDVRNTMFGGSMSTGLGEDGSLSGGMPSPGMSRTPASAGAGAGPSVLSEEPDEMESAAPNGLVPNGVRPTQAVRQASMSSVVSNNPFESPSLAQSTAAAPAAIPVAPLGGGALGLRASISETVNVIMHAGAVTRAQITGEIHLSLRMQDGAASGPIHIRLTSFEQLEKIAPNPAYLAQVPDKPGEYFLNADVLASATSRLGSAGKGTLLFKYQVHVPEGKESQVAPVLVSPAWQCKEGETRMIINYRPNPSSPLVRPSDLENLSLIASFAPGGPSVSNVQAKPSGGVWSPQTRRMTWNLGKAADSEGKVIAKLVTESGGALEPAGVMVGWAAEGALGSGLGVEVVQAPEAVRGADFEEVRKAVGAGKYLAEA